MLKAKIMHAGDGIKRDTRMHGLHQTCHAALPHIACVCDVYIHTMDRILYMYKECVNVLCINYTTGTVYYTVN